MTNEAQYLRLLNALQAVEAGAPTAEDLQDAPLIEDWMSLSLGGRFAALSGKITGHPDVAGESSITSILLMIDIEAGWARTISHWYQLGAQPVLDGRTWVEYEAAKAKAHRPELAEKPLEKLVSTIRMNLILNGLHEIGVAELPDLMQAGIENIRQKIDEFQNNRVLQ